MAQLLLLLLLLWADFTVGDVHKRIIGGQPCHPDERKYHVLLRGDNRTHMNFCGGSLISNQWILTASHCWPPGWTMRANLTVHPGPGLDVPLQNDPQHRIPFIDNQGQHDIMLLRLTTPVNNPHTIPVPACNDANANLTLFLCFSLGIALQPVRDLQCANVSVVHCVHFGDLRADGQILFQNQHYFCGRAPGVDTCGGDSGGGVVYRGQIYGVISGSGCRAHAHPIRFMNVCNSTYREWIRDTAHV
uniref:Peptidase S1 domain-containing protein n=1 Tax=Myripristis murdjan TaxID=586833 RepID=A0A667WG34_9TELE